MAGMPRSIVERATSILTQLEKKHIEGDAETKGEPKVARPATEAISTEAMQLSIFETVDPLAGQLKAALLDLQINNMTPIECMMKLNELKKLMEE
jgi:DNA mismatch repair protein MutS